MEKKRVGVISLTDPREIKFVQEREEYIEACHNQLITFLRKKQVEVIDPLSKLRKIGKKKVMFGVRTSAEIKYCIDFFRQGKIEALLQKV